MKKILLLTAFFTVLSTISFGQTQEEIEQMMNGTTTEESTEKVKKEKNKKEKKTEKEAEESTETLEELVEEAIEAVESEGEAATEEVEEAAEKAKKEKKKKGKETEEVVEETVESTEEKVEEAIEEVTETTETTTETVEEVTEEVEAKSTNALPTFDVDEELGSLKYKKLKKEGDANFENGNFFTAIDYYQAAITRTKKKKKLHYARMQLGESFYTLRDYENAQDYFYSVGSEDKKNKYPTAEFQLANTYKYQAKYDTAMTVYRAFLSQSESAKDLDFEKGRARLEVKGCKFGDTLYVDFEEYVVENAGADINGPYADYGVALLRDNQLVYSKINADRATAEESGMTEDNFSKLYTANGTFSDILNEGEKYIGNPSFTEDGNTIYFTKCELVTGGNTKCDIYTSSKSGGEWSAPVKVDGINDDNASTTQPFITKNIEGNTVLYFVSEREKGRGGKDIWYALLNEDGSFDRAKNMGYPINTRYDDVSPFYHPATKTFYFSSNGHVSLGGFDVFQSVQDEDGDFQDPTNLKTPINSSLDDYDFILTASGKEGYVVSNRLGTTTVRSITCCDDVWSANRAVIEVTVIGEVYAKNETSKQLLEGSTVKIVDADLTEIVGETIFTGEPFSFLIEADKNYKLIAEHELFETVELPFNTNGIAKPEMIEKSLTFTERNVVNMVVGVIYYDYNQSKLREDAPDTLQRVVSFMENYPNTTLEIGAHTDAKGQEKYNEALSKRRAEAAMNFLINEGKIDENRIEISWYGETEPVAPNENEDGSDNPDGRAKNRRTEFKVTGEDFETKE